MEGFFDWIIDAVTELLAELFSDREGRSRRGRRIGRRWTTVPELQDLSVAQAREALARAGLRMTVVRQTADTDPATGRVLGQDPPPWQPAPRRHRVTVRI
jgi:hypothetical protein